MTAEGSDIECLAAFVQRGDESAFRQLVDRHIGVVYAAARRQVGGGALADDVTQTVFILLARKAKKIDAAMLVGWLLKTCYLVSRDVRRSEQRRVRREQKAILMGNTMSAPRQDPQSIEMSPLMDEALARLSERDRAAVCLRYVQDLSLGEVGAAVGISEAAAAKRVNRAVAKLRRFLGAKGTAVTASAIVAGLSAQKGQACPPGLAAATAGKALAAAKVVGWGSGSSLLLKGIIVMSTAKKVGLIAAVLLLLLGGGVAVTSMMRSDRGPEAGAAPTGAAASPTASVVAAASAPPVATGDRIKVGVYLSAFTATGPFWKAAGSPYGWKDQQIPARALRDPSIELIPVIEPGTQADPTLSSILRSSFPGKTPIDATNLQELRSLNVLVSQAAHNVPDAVQSAFDDAVFHGVGFLNRGFMTVTPGYNSTFADLSGLDGVFYGWTMQPIECEIVGDSPLLGDLNGHVGSTMMIEMAGPIGLLKGIPLIRVKAMDQVSIRRGSRVDEGMGMYPFYLSQFGQGRIVAFAFAHYQVPAVLNTANHGRFYIHCVQWLAKKPLT